MTVPGLDLDRLAARLAEAGVTRGPLTAELIEGGKSNLTYVVRDADRTVVVRRPPLGHVLATAHDMGREFRVMGALQDTDVPVPRMYHFCDDVEVVGAPFYVMEYVEGTPTRLSPEVGEHLADVLARLHVIDPAKVGLGDFGRPEGFLDRQVNRWKRQLDASRSRELAGIDELFARLAADVPASGPAAIVHGDFKLGNTLIRDGRVAAVLDWEMSTLGDPLTDLALFLLYADFPHLDIGALGGEVDTAALAAHYTARSGRDTTRLGWYVGLACFKLAVITEGIYFRFTQGLTVGAGFEDIGDIVAPLVERGLREV
uniref:phosphotransferase family protein n=1 Tax=Herbidospora sakaeratensis TaxID=564415 RepID=UPI000781CFAE|nr:phosphotransferase family protein [Herbidospora sakaeratensis]